MLTLYKASAGSGKTYNLAKEYLRHLLAYKTSDGRYHLRYNPTRGKSNGRAHQHILAITFTVAATNEMKKRIIEALDSLSRCDQDDVNSKNIDYRDEFISEFNTDAKTLAQASRIALKELLFNFNEFSVSTIDSFFQLVLRAFAREIDLPGDFEVELDEKRVVAIAVDEIISKLNRPDEAPSHEQRVKNERLTSWLIDFMAQNIDNGGGFNLFNRKSSLHSTLIETLNSMMDEKFMINRTKISEYLADGTRLDGFRKELDKLYETSDKKLKETSYHALQLIDALCGNDKKVSSHLIKAFQKFAENGVSEKMGTTIPNILVCPEKKYLKKYQDLVGGDIDREIQSACQTSSECVNNANLSKALKKSLYNFGILSYVLEQMELYRQDEDKVLISDTNDKLGRIIGDDTTPFIYDRIGYPLQHFLLDEFQDTSEMQWHNLKPLLLESLSYNHDNLIIGDEKQCIYRFRNSAPDLLGKKVKQELQKLRINNIAERGIDSAENTNWRSAPEIIRFNNSFFTSFAQVVGIPNTYSSVVQEISPKHAETRGYVDVMAIEKEEQSDSIYIDTALKRMGDEIARQLAAGYKPKDIAVIVRFNSEGTKVINYLLNRIKTDKAFPIGTKITSSESIDVDSSSAVKLIVSVLRFIDSAESPTDRGRDQRALARLINQFEYNFNRSDKNPASDGIDCSKSLIDALDSIDSGNHQNSLADNLFNEVKDMEYVSLPSIVELIIARYFNETERNYYNIFLSAFQDQVLDFCAQGLSDIHSFLEWWDQTGHNRKVEIPASINALTVITIHKAKGLQYKCVHVPFATWSLTKYAGNKNRYEWFELNNLDGVNPEFLPHWIPLKLEKTYSAIEPFRSQVKEIFTQQIIDNTNLLYVAFTRAERELIVTTQLPPNSNASVKAVRDSGHPDNSTEEIKAEDIPGYIDLAMNYWDKAKTEQKAGDRPHLFISLSDKLKESTIETNDIDPDALEATRLTIGTPTTPSQSEKTEPQNDNYAMPPYVTYTHHGKENNKKTWAYAKADDVFDLNDSRKQGSFLHNVLSSVRHKEDLKLAFNRLAYRALLSDEERTRYFDMLQNALSDTRVEKWFDGYSRVVNERTIMLSDGSAYRPDRIVWLEDGTIDIIDYKFGEHEKKYLKQVNGYINFLKQIYPAATVRGFLWYPTTATILPVN